MTEIWKSVPGFEALYEVSDQGRVRSLDRAVWCEGPEKGRYLSRKKGRILSPGRMNGGHLSVALGKGHSRCVHELVLLAFVGPRPERHEARHLDGRPDNNLLTNLVWDTRGNNGRDKKWHAGVSRYKLTPKNIALIKQRLSPRIETYAAIAEDFDVSPSTVFLIRKGCIHGDV